MPVPSLSDFPPATKFWVKGMDVPVAWAPPDGVAVSWYGGRLTEWQHKYLETVLTRKDEGLSEVTFTVFIELIEKSLDLDLDRGLSAWPTLPVDASLEERVQGLRARIDDDFNSGKEPRSDKGDFLFARRGKDGFPDPEAD